MLLTAFLVVAFGSSAQKTINDPNVALRSVGGFNAIKVAGGIDLYISYGEPAVAVSAKDADLRDRIKTEVSDGVLKIWYEWKEKGTIQISGNKQLRAYVSYKTLVALSGSGGSDIFSDGTINSPLLTLQVSGGSDFKGKINVDDLKINASGGSDVKIEGVAKTATIDASGGSDVNAFELMTEKARVEASGGSDIEITVTKEMNASASGGSDIRYKGEAQVASKNSSGSSGIKKM